MTLAEIKQRYPNEWVLIEFTQLDEELSVVDGYVVAHSPNKAEIYQKLIDLENERIAIEFTGEQPEEPAYLLRSSIVALGSLACQFLNLAVQLVTEPEADLLSQLLKIRSECRNQTALFGFHEYPQGPRNRNPMVGRSSSRV